MGEDTLVVSDGDGVQAEAVAASGGEQTSSADYFAQVRLSRQESRDSAVELLEQTIAYDEGTEVLLDQGTFLEGLTLAIRN